MKETVKCFGIEMHKVARMGSRNYEYCEIPKNPILFQLKNRIPKTYKEAFDIRKKLEFEESEYRQHYYFVNAHLASLADVDLHNMRKMYLNDGLKIRPGKKYRLKSKSYREYHELQDRIMRAYLENEKQYWSVKILYSDMIQRYYHFSNQLAYLEEMGKKNA